LSTAQPSSSPSPSPLPSPTPTPGAPPQRPARWRAILRALHRDLGYFFFGVTCIYAISGLAMNHRADWNPNYSVEKRTHTTTPEIAAQTPLTKDTALALLSAANVHSRYKKHYAPDDRHVRIFLDNGAATLNRADATLDIELLHRRPLLATFNKLHLNPGRAWRWFADTYAIALLLLAVTGLFLLRGKHGLTRRGGLLAAAGIIIPAIIVYLNP
jgi:hypothetical protein